MKKLSIQCKGVCNISNTSSGLNIELENVFMDFLDDISVDNILLYCDNIKLFKNMNYETITKFIENKTIEKSNENWYVD